MYFLFFNILQNIFGNDLWVDIHLMCSKLKPYFLVKKEIIWTSTKHLKAWCMVWRFWVWHSQLYCSCGHFKLKDTQCFFFLRKGHQTFFSFWTSSMLNKQFIVSMTTWDKMALSPYPRIWLVLQESSYRLTCHSLWAGS